MTNINNNLETAYSAYQQGTAANNTIPNAISGTGAVQQSTYTGNYYSPGITSSGTGNNIGITGTTYIPNWIDYGNNGVYYNYTHPYPYHPALSPMTIGPNYTKLIEKITKELKPGETVEMVLEASAREVLAEYEQGGVALNSPSPMNDKLQIEKLQKELSELKASQEDTLRKALAKEKEQNSSWQVEQLQKDLRAKEEMNKTLSNNYCLLEKELVAVRSKLAEDTKKLEETVSAVQQAILVIEENKTLKEKLEQVENALDNSIKTSALYANEIKFIKNHLEDDIERLKEENDTLRDGKEDTEKSLKHIDEETKKAFNAPIKKLSPSDPFFLFSLIAAGAGISKLTEKNSEEATKLLVKEIGK